MRDFTPDTLRLLLSSLQSAGYRCLTVAAYLRNPVAPAVMLRHDIDARPENALYCAQMEAGMGIAGTYYFRSVPGSYNESVIRQISELGHEVGYHYEDLAATRGDFEKAITLFADNLAKLRRLVPIETICMHGSPLSKFDNRLLWEKYDYREYGIIGEPYLDIEFDKVSYLTDTGRCWNGDRFSLRDKAKRTRGISVSKQVLPSDKKRLPSELTLHNTFDIIRALKTNQIPSVILMTIHPQRWSSEIIPWTSEMVFQNVKNLVKGLINRYDRFK